MNLNRTKTGEWINIGESDLEEMIKKSAKKRHELIDGKIRRFMGIPYP